MLSRRALAFRRVNDKLKTGVTAKGFFIEVREVNMQIRYTINVSQAVECKFGILKAHA